MRKLVFEILIGCYGKKNVICEEEKRLMEDQPKLP